VGTREFFEGLESAADPARLAGVTQSYRFEIEGAGSWRVQVADGRLSVVEGSGEPADATIRASAAVFDRIVAREQNPATAYMTGKVKVDGDLRAVLKLKQLFG